MEKRKIYQNLITRLFFALLVASHTKTSSGVEFKEMMSKSEMEAEVQKGLKENVKLLTELSSMDVVLRDTEMKDRIEKLKKMKGKEKIGTSDERVMEELTDYYVQKLRIEGYLDDDHEILKDLPYTPSTTKGMSQEGVKNDSEPHLNRQSK